MKDIFDKSEFYHFGILPQICIHALKEDEYSKMYIPRKTCDCGHKEWIESEMDIIKPIPGINYPKKAVHRCKKCNEVRLSDHIGMSQSTED